MKRIRENIYLFSVNNDNAYLITGDKNVLIDTVSKEFEEEYINAVSEKTDIKDIDYIIINHAEPQRSGCLESILRINPDIKVVATTAGLKFLHAMLGCDFNEVLAKENTELLINGKEIRFITAPYINWPDSMLTLYDKFLFSCDFMSNFDGDVSKYYEEYLSDYEEFVKNAAEYLSDFEIDTIFPGSGNEVKGVGLFNVIPEKGNNIVIIYTSLFGNTEKMANIIYKNIDLKNTEIFNLDEFETDFLAKKINDAKALIIGTNTVNADIPYKLWEIIAKTNKISNKFKPCMLFSSYGWGNEGMNILEKHLKLLRYNIFEKPFSVNFRIKKEEVENLIDFTKRFINSL